MQKIIYAIPLIFVLLTGFSRSSLSYNAFAQNYLDVSTSVNSVYADQMTPEDKRQPVRDKFEERNKIRDSVKDRVHDRVYQDARENTREKLQVDDGSYYGDVVELPEEDIINYILSFQGNAFSTSDADNVKTISRAVYLELLRLGDSGAILKIIGGQIVIVDPVTGESYNVHDVFFGRSRANFDNASLQVAINTVDVGGQPHTFVMQTSMDGLFPTTLGAAIDIHATDGKSKSGTKWILDFVDTLTVDYPIPITVLEDVEDDVVEDFT